MVQFKFIMGRKAIFIQLQLQTVLWGEFNSKTFTKYNLYLYLLDCFLMGESCTRKDWQLWPRVLWTWRIFPWINKDVLYESDHVSIFSLSSEKKDISTLSGLVHHTIFPLVGSENHCQNFNPQFLWRQLSGLFSICLVNQKEKWWEFWRPDDSHLNVYW